MASGKECNTHRRVNQNCEHQEGEIEQSGSQDEEKCAKMSNQLTKEQLDKKEQHSKKGSEQQQAYEKRERSRSKEKKNFSNRWRKATARPVKPDKTVKVNKYALTSILMENKKTNFRLDQEQVDRAAHKFQQTFGERINPVTLSAYLSNQELKQTISKQTQLFLFKCPLKGCDQRFKMAEQLQLHVEKHKQSILKKP